MGSQDRVPRPALRRLLVPSITPTTAHLVTLGFDSPAVQGFFYFIYSLIIFKLLDVFDNRFAKSGNVCPRAVINAILI